MTKPERVRILSTMVDDMWRQRLEKAVESSGRSAREISVSMGRTPGYVHSLLKSEREPSLSNLVSTCDELGISVVWLLYGIEIDEESNKLLRLFNDLPPEGREHLMNLVKSASSLKG